MPDAERCSRDNVNVAIFPAENQSCNKSSMKILLRNQAISSRTDTKFYQGKSSSSNMKGLTEAVVVY